MNAVHLRVSPLLKRTQREKRQADENGFSLVAPHDDRLMRKHGDMSGHRSRRIYNISFVCQEFYSSSAVHLRVSPLLKRTQSYRSRRSFASSAYQEL